MPDRWRHCEGWRTSERWWSCRSPVCCGSPVAALPVPRTASADTTGPPRLFQGRRDLGRVVSSGTPLGRVLRRRDRRVILRPRLGAAAQPSQEVGSGGVPRVISGEGERVDDRQRDIWAIELGDRDRPVERDDRGRRDGEQLVVQRDDLRPVGVARVVASVWTALIAAMSW